MSETPDDSDVLYHVTLICPTRSEVPGAQGDERIYTRFGQIKADRLALKLIYIAGRAARSR